MLAACAGTALLFSFFRWLAFLFFATLINLVQTFLPQVALQEEMESENFQLPPSSPSVLVMQAPGSSSTASRENILNSPLAKSAPTSPKIASKMEDLRLDGSAPEVLAVPPTDPVLKSPLGLACAAVVAAEEEEAEELTGFKLA